MRDNNPSPEAVTPDKIYLQPEEGYMGSTTWCSDKITEDDVKYIRADKVDEALAPYRSALEECLNWIERESLKLIDKGIVPEGCQAILDKHRQKLSGEQEGEGE